LRKRVRRDALPTTAGEIRVSKASRLTFPGSNLGLEFFSPFGFGATNRFQRFLNLALFGPAVTADPKGFTLAVFVDERYRQSVKPNEQMALGDRYYYKVSITYRMAVYDDITFDPAIIGGRPCIRGMRVTLGMIVGMIAANHHIEETSHLYPYRNVKTSCRLSVVRRGGARREK
jgi:uncharacterized protein (DUF433 family)